MKLPIEDMRAMAEEMSGRLRALANRDRLMMLCRLSEGEASVGELVAITGISQSLASQHLAMLRDVGAVKVRQERQSRFYSIADPKVAAIFEALCAVCGVSDGQDQLAQAC